MSNISDLAKALHDLHEATSSGVDEETVRGLEQDAQRILRLTISELGGGPATY